MASHKIGTGRILRVGNAVEFRWKKSRFHYTPEEIKREIENRSVKSLYIIGGRARKIAFDKIKHIPWNPSRPPHPPHTRTGALKNSFAFAVSKAKKEVIIGPTHSGIGLIAHLHEFGGSQWVTDQKGKRVIAHYPARRTMLPTLQKIAPMLPTRFAKDLQKT